MLDIAKRHRRSIALLMASDDDGVLQDAAYLTQQMIEKLLKHVYECCGERYPFGHDIGSLLVKLPEKQSIISEELLEKLMDRADTFSSWESKTRYPNPYLAARRLVERHIALADELCATIEGALEPSAGHPRTVGLQQMNLFGAKQNTK